MTLKKGREVRFPAFIFRVGGTLGRSATQLLQTDGSFVISPFLALSYLTSTGSGPSLPRAFCCTDLFVPQPFYFFPVNGKVLTIELNIFASPCCRRRSRVPCLSQLRPKRGISILTPACQADTHHSRFPIVNADKYPTRFTPFLAGSYRQVIVRHACFRVFNRYFKILRPPWIF